MDVERGSDGKADEDEEDLVTGPFDAADNETKPGPEEGNPDEFGEAELEERRSTSRPIGEHKDVGVGEEVEAREAHDNVVEIVSAKGSVVAAKLGQGEERTGRGGLPSQSRQTP